MLFREHIRKLRPIQESFIPPVEKVQSFLQEGKLTPAELIKRDSRINLFIQKLKASDPFELDGGGTVVLKYSADLENSTFL